MKTSLAKFTILLTLASCNRDGERTTTTSIAKNPPVDTANADDVTQGVGESPTAVTTTNGSSASSPLPVGVVPRYLSDLLLWDNSQLETVFTQSESRLLRCMNSAGFEFEVGEFSPPPAPGKRVLYPDTILVEKYGYGWRARQLGDEFHNADGTALSGPEATAYTKCQAAVHKDLSYDVLIDLQTLVSNTSNDIELQIDSDSDVAIAMTRWSQCMAKGGYSLSTTDEAEVTAGNSNEGTDGESNIIQAVSDYQCRRDVRLAEVITSRRNQLVDDWLEVNFAVIEAVQEAQQEVFRRANDGE